MLEDFIDPVCGVTVNAMNARGLREYRGRMHYFCSREHMEIFDRDPEKYSRKGEWASGVQSNVAEDTKSY